MAMKPKKPPLPVMPSPKTGPDGAPVMPEFMSRAKRPGGLKAGGKVPPSQFEGSAKDMAQDKKLAAKMAKGGGVESRGKTKGRMV